MAKLQTKKRFSPRAFMTALDGDGTVSSYGESQVVFSQGALADAVFYIHYGKLKLSVSSEIFAARGAWPVNLSGCPLR